MSGAFKKRRLDARAFRDYHMSLAMKPKGLNGCATELGNLTSLCGCEKLEACSSKDWDSKSDNVQLPLLRDDSVNPQPDNGEATVKQNCDSVPNVLPDNPDKTPSVESGSDGKCNEVEGAPNFKVQRLLQQKSAPRFIEYWVPVGFSYLQLEKYCETLIKNALFLSSSTKNGLVDLHDILTSIRECCDHPYIVDSSLQNFLNDGRPTAGILTTGIEASGKFVLLENFLHNIKKKGLRVAIVYQSNHSKSDSMQLRHLLDDFIHRRFGEESYVHIYRDFDFTKKRAACHHFNDNKSGKFVMLIEKSSCQSCIKLDSVDVVILFNSDWCPINDMRCLRKLSIQSTHDHLNVLRFYSPNSVEEKVLSLAKEGAPLEGSVQNISRSTGQTLLLWGTTHLFSMLDEFHEQCTSITNLNSLFEDRLSLDVLQELFMLLSSEDGKCCNHSLISKVPNDSDGYSATISLHGEQYAPDIDDDVPSCAIWDSVLAGRNPRWRLLPVSSPRIRKRGYLSASLASYSEFDNSTSQKTLHVQVETLCQKPRSPRTRKKRGVFSASLLHLPESRNKNDFIPSKKTLQLRNESPRQKSRSVKASRLAPGSTPGNSADHPNPSGSGDEPSSCSDDHDCTSRIEESCNRRLRDLMLKQKKEIRDFYRTNRDEKEKLEEEHKLAIDLINQGRREVGAKQEEFKRLDHIYGQKFAEHNHQMDMRRKMLEDVQRAARLREKELKEKLIALTKGESFDGSMSSLLDFEHRTQTPEHAVGAAPTVSVPAPCSETKQSEVIEQGIVDNSEQHEGPAFTPDCLVTDTEILSAEPDGENDKQSEVIERGIVDNAVQHDGRVLTPDYLVAETEILSVESDGENDAISMPRGELSNATHPAEVSLAPFNTVSNSISLVGKQPEDAHPLPNSRAERNGSLNIGNSDQTLRGVSVEKQFFRELQACMSEPRESDGENDVVVCQKKMDGESNLRAANESLIGALSRRNPFESTVNSLIKEVQHKDCNTGASAGLSNGQLVDTSDMAAELGNTSDVALLLSAEEQEPTELPSSRLIRSNTVQVQSQDDAGVNNSLPLEQVESLLAFCEASPCELSGQDHVESVPNIPNGGLVDRQHNIDGSVRVSGEEIGNGTAAELDTTVAVPQSVQEQESLEFLTSNSSLISSSLVSVVFQDGVSGNTSLPLVQPVVPVCLPSTEIRQSAEASVMSSYQISGTPSSFHLDQNPSPLRNSGSSNMSSQLFNGREQSSIPSAGYTTITQPSNSFSRGLTSLRPNIQPNGCDPLKFELKRLEMEAKEAVKIHGEKTLLLESALQKELDEVRKKYDSLRNEADIEFLQKKVAIESACTKVRANKYLADAFSFYYLRQQPPPVSQEALLSHILELPLLRQRNVPTQMPAATSPAPTPPQLQVVHHLSDLMSIVPMRLGTSSPSCRNDNSPLGYPVRAAASNLRQYGSPNASMSVSDISSIPGLPSQLRPVLHPRSMPANLWRQFTRPVVMCPPEGTPFNPVVL